MNISAGVGELEQRENITEILVNGVCIREGQPQHAPCVDHSTSKCHQVCTKHMVGT
jgi:hypothetical protein